jgi:NTE family protein
LSRLSATKEEYATYRSNLEHRQHPVPRIDDVVVENESRLSPKVIAARLSAQKGERLDIDRLESDISNIYGFDTFETVTYDVITDAGENTLVVRATEKSWGPNYLRFGINLEDDFDGNSSYNIAARIT